jgi:phenylalanyl-tRNA synthetase alpha chain
MELIETVLSEGMRALEQAKDNAALEIIRVEFLGKSGRLTELLKRTSTLSIEERSKGQSGQSIVARSSSTSAKTI